MSKSVILNGFAIIIFGILLNLFHARASDVLGCGGFIKSHVQIDFSKVEVKLYTKQGILKDKTNCAPNNGYYFIPLYDKGDYVLQLEPPAGWSFNPTKVNILVDGTTDACTQGKDINFVFEGFGITGKVENIGTPGKGPIGVTVELKSDAEKTRMTTTIADGNFFFTPVYPGTYTVYISHPKWKIKKSTVQVKLTVGNTDIPRNSLLVLGYDVKGAVRSDKEPVKDVTVVLFKHEDNELKIEVDGCDTSSLPEFPSKTKPLCHVKTNENGEFIFPAVSNGHYYVMPFYKGQNIHFEPTSISFHINDDSRLLPDFEIIGFSISGKVLDSVNGKPVSDATVFLNNKKIDSTNENGLYVLEKIKAGTYKLKVVVDSLQFDEKVLKVNPSLNQLPDFIPKAYKVCGRVISEKSQSITINRIGSTFMLTTNSGPSDGMFCEFLGPGKYQIEVTVSNTDRLEGIQFYPIMQTVEVTSKPLTDIMFSQLKATVIGKIQCLREKDCADLKVLLRSVVNDISISDKDIEVTVSGNSYKFTDVRPGHYEVIINAKNLCWKFNNQNVHVNSVTVNVPAFVQTGYVVIFTTTHSSEVVYKLPDQTTKTNRFEIQAGRNVHCVKKAGLYDFMLKSCHIFDGNNNNIIFNTDSENNEFFLTFKKHTLTLSIASEESYDNVLIDIIIKGKTYEKGPLPYSNKQYILEFYLDSKETALITPKSNIIFFNPPSLTVQGQLDCVNLGTKFTAIKGLIFEGKIIPPLAGVQITIQSDENKVVTYVTDSEGSYKFLPLDPSKKYTISANKNSYILNGPDDKGNFVAHKLAEIVVHVIDESNNEPLMGALVSLSGGESYRSNLQTDENGLITFHSLSPSEYFLRPMMKEYIFEPSSKIIRIEDGATLNIQLKGKRVAYSAFGTTISLNGDAEAGVIVAASGTGNCSHFSEETISESTGHFRIRGLQPYCLYDIKVKGYFDQKHSVERTAPAVLNVDNIQEDVTGLKIILFRAALNTDILVHILAQNPDHYKTMRIKVSRESPPSSLVHTIKLDVSNYKITKDYNAGVLIQVPSVLLDGNSYSVQLESTLPQANQFEPKIEYFVANTSFRFVRMEFVVKTNLIDQQIKQTSIWTLILIFGIMFAMYNIDKIANFSSEQFSKLNVGGSVSSVKQKPVVAESSVDPSEIDQLVQSINAVKRKPKAKKT